MTDEQIVNKLNKRPTEDPRVAACRKILQLTGQWPWEWAKDFEPKTWTTSIVSDLCILIRGIRYSEDLDPSLICGNFKKVKDVLREKACERNSENPQLQLQDVTHALNRFQVRVATRRKVRHEPLAALKTSIAATPVVRPPTATVANDSDEVDEGIECLSPQIPPIKEGKGISPGQDAAVISISSDSDDEGVPTTPRSQERSAIGLQTHTRARAVEQESPFEVQIYNVASVCPSPEEE
ncbi:hypothetical protein FLONG3_244 [Fusarium longipes]|uniref:Uncharacterized protein n=1 Tax=Fusarium longipes TaxID=694270 RepID=A0A395TA75_9HYPO|nr:hypothetical protein FLONG3_244 [Fusarium longipes]